jgi:hypothetical protein
MGHALLFLTYALVLGSALAGFVGAPFWTFVVGGACLSMIPIWEQEKLRSRFTSLRATNVLGMSHLASIVDSCIVSAAAWAIGALLRLVLMSV